MPWEKSFDEEIALEKAMKVFWQKGFEPASIADLLEETGLNRGSLYNAFGGKQQLFVKSLLKYDRDIRQSRLAQLEALDNPKEAIAAFFDTIVAETVADRDHKGCFLINTASEIAAHDEEVNEIVTNGVREIEAFFRRCIEVGQARGDMPEGIDPEDTAKTLLALIVAIRVLGRGVFAEAALLTIANAGKRLICLN
ncbi:transcriptional regulator, TetR family [Nitrosomonas aestuarii]|uniref:Transcriptional regulator, TetR family n=1 Tax=Nitrosomonas aestuarii TaxID=52441 RepID=A0A1I4ANJ5_9PROT|nr:TetR/AcrR family transcriptional regulator [Nitrosomonas aestuarii]SFK57790.1 transcriptional regulator, TetR family [Nitrosomonas aestuarii]